MSDGNKVSSGLREALVDVLGVEPEEVVSAANFFLDLGGESIDLLDLEFHLGHRFSVKMQFAELGQLWQQDADGQLTQESAAKLQAAWPILRQGELASIAETGNWQQLVTVDLIQRLLQYRIKQAQESPDPVHPA